MPGAHEGRRGIDETGEAHPVHPAGESAASRRARRGSGRVRHDEKITVYISSEELLALETARLTLRGHGLAVDRGRIVREAIAMALEGLDEQGDESDLVQRLHR